MRKSIYYLIANTVSLVAAFIFALCLDGSCPIYGFNLEVVGLSTAFEPFKFVLLVEALSIVLCAEDVISNSKHKGEKVPFTMLKNILGGIITIGSILYTWICILLTYENYYIGEKINVPYFFIAFFLVGALAIYLTSFLAKKNDNLGVGIVLGSLLLMVTGVLYECLPYWYTLVPCLVVVVIACVVPLLFKKKVTTK